jgi:hypothetical protein
LLFYVLQNDYLNKSFISAKSSIAVERSDVYVISSLEFCTSSISSTSDFKENKFKNLEINGHTPRGPSRRSDKILNSAIDAMFFFLITPLWSLKF